MIELRDKDKNRVAGLVDYENLCIESVLESGDKTLTFYYPKKGKYYDEIVEEGYIITKKDEFVVKARELEDDYTKFECSLNLEELEGTIFDRFESVEQTITSALNLAIVGTGWTVKDNTLKKRRTIRCTNKSSLEIVREIKKVYRVDIVFNTLKKQIEVYEHLGEDKGTYFIDSLNLIALQVQSDSRQYATRIIAEGKDGLSFSDINNGKNYVENYQYSNKVKTIYWKDERYSVKESLLEDARAKLEELSKPFRSYSASILNLAELNPRYSSILDFKLGDVINLISKKNKIKDKQRIVKIIEWPQDHTKDSVELANATLKFEDIQQENQETSDTVSNITTDNGTINGSTIDSIQVKQIENFEANVLKVTKLEVIEASINHLSVIKADIQELNVVKANIGTLEATKANITELNSVKADLQQAIIGKANITDLNAAVGKINVLESKTASIENALLGNLTAENFKANSIVAGSGIIADGAIGSAQISSLSVNKLEAGDITTSKHRIVSADGTIEIVGNQILINRNNINRVILGEYRKLDNTTDYGLLIRGKDGRTVMFDSDGVHNAGITDGAIDNNKVADNANISGNKLDINSVIREVNTHGTETIKGTKVQIEDRTLDVELSTQKNTITEHGKELSSQKASLTALDNALKFKVDSQTFTQSTTTINNNINRAKEEAINTANNNTSNIINNLDIGVENLLSDSNKIVGESSNGEFIQFADIAPIIDKYGLVKYTISFDIKSKDISKCDVVNCYCQNGSATKYSIGYNPIKVTRDFKRVHVTITPTLSNSNETKAMLAFYGNYGTGNIPIIKNVKIELGQFATTYSLSKEDLKKYSDDVAQAKADLAQANAIANADGKITEEERKRIQQAQENLNTAIARADKAKQDAINAASLDATNKANNALNNAKAYTNSEITTVNTHLNKATTEINLLKGEINLKVNQTDIDKTIKTIEDKIKSTTEKITTVESNLTQKTNSIEAGVRDLNSTTQTITTNISNLNRDLSNKINSNLSEAKSFATDIAIAKANLAKEQAIASADGKITAEEQKRIQQAQTNLNTAIAKAIEAETKAKSYADVKKQEAINSANNNTNNAINNIKIGGRNYGLNTDVMQQEPYNIIFSKDLVFEKGKTYTISMDFDLENLVKGSQERVGCEGSILFKDGTRQYIGVWHWISQGATFKGRKSYTFTIENKDIKDNMTSIHIYTELVSSGKRNLGRFKIEEGNKATDYTIAPEDLQSYADKVAKAKADLAQANAIANADGKITEEERKRIQQAQENLNTAIARADKAKQDAINTASTDATNKANNALNSAKAFVNAEITTVNNKVHNVESNLNILKDQIKSKVSQSDIEKSISEMKIGGRNLLPLTPRNYISAHMSIWNWGFANRKISELGLKVGDKITFSIWSKFGNVQTGGRARISFYDIKNNNIKTVSNSDMINPNEEGFSFVTVEIPPNTETVWVGLQRGNPVGDGALEFDFLIKMPKLEIGTKATDWTPAPEDLNQSIADNIKIVDSKISDVSSSVTQLRDSVTTDIRAINSKTQSIETTLNGKASKQEVTEVNNRVATIKASLDSITQRVSSTESKTQTLESNLNGKASKQEVSNVSSKVVSLETNLNGITNRVSNTESRINTLDGKVASAVTNQQFTEFKQSNDKFKFTVEQRSSVSNILPNSSFFGGDRGWLHDGVEFWYGSYSGYGFKGRMTGAIKNRTSYNNPERFLQTHKAYKVKKNTTYTISFHYACEMNIHSMEAYVVLSDTEHGDYAQPIRILEKPGGTQSDPNNDIPFTYKFNTGNHEWVWLRFDHNGMKSGTNWDQYCWLYVSEIGIYEGDVGAVKWTPKGGEVYSANYQMDGLGFKGTFEDGTYASLGKDGLEWYNAGTGHAYHALTYVTSFDIPVGNPGKAYIKLPAEFTKRRSSLKWTVALRGYYYSTSGNFFPFHVHCTGARDYIENGLVVCEVQGLCKIQNGSNSGDVQFRPLTAMLIAIA
ncbi:TPA: hypothetical protein I9Z76_002683 [Clostridium perfringens]|nr:hypothetical protein [Clostridium perfringens]